MYGQVITTKEVAQEYGHRLPEWVKIKSASDKFSQQILELNIDKGEASAIALALECPESTIILDDYKARKVAEHLRLHVTGTIGILVKAKLKGIIPAVKPYLTMIRKTDFRLLDEIVKQALSIAGEYIKNE